MTSTEVKKCIEVQMNPKEWRILTPNCLVGPTICYLKKFVSSDLQIDPQHLRILTWGTPTPIGCLEDSMDIGALISSREIVVVEDISSEPRCIAFLSAEFDIGEPVNMRLVPEGILERFVMPANNSCLFTSVDFVATNGKADLSKSSDLRYTIAFHVTLDPLYYNEAVLGMSNLRYCDWVTYEGHRGGAVELSILCKHFKLEIAVVDKENMCLRCYGTNSGYEKRAFLICSGSHYSPVGLKLADKQPRLQTCFSVHNQNFLDIARRINLRLITINFPP